MNAVLFMLHLFGLAIGVGSTVGNFAIMQVVRSSPGDAPTLRKLSAPLGRIGQTGLAVLWVTGLILVWTVYGGPANLPMLFWWKFLFVVVVTALVGLMDVTARQMRAGNTAGAARMPIYGMVNALFLILTVIFAVLAFYPH